MYILALDQGTTSSRALLFDREGEIRAQAQREFAQHYPRPGWVEHDPEELWQSQLAVARQVLEKAGARAAEVEAIGLSNQRETTLVWERRTGAPIHNAIVWQDRRTAPLCQQVREEGCEPLFRERTGLLLDPYFSGTKLRWLLDQVPGARARAARGELAFGTVDTWLLWKLTGGRHHLTDLSNAARTLLCDIRSGAWDAELLDALDIPPDLLPEIRASSAVYAETDAALLGASLPIAGVAGDQQAALFGQMCVRPGMAKNTYGTGCFLLMHTGQSPRPSQHRLLTTPAWKIGGRTDYALEGSVFVAGAAIQWLRDGLGLIRRAAEVEALARSVDDNGGVFMVPAFTGLGAPHWDPHARGTITGLTRGSSAGHLARAALESIAQQTADVLEAMRADSGLDMAELRVDGGAAASDLLLQFQADLLGVPVLRARQAETTALGAACLAGLATGFWKDRQVLESRWREAGRFEPSMGAERVTHLRADWQKALERARGWAAETS